METLKAGCFLIDKVNQSIALIYREKQKDYSFPKGHVDPGEDIRSTAIRETAEEIKRVALGVGIGIIDEKIELKWSKLLIVGFSYLTFIITLIFDIFVSLSFILFCLFLVVLSLFFIYIILSFFIL